ncbi:MAG: tyrosine-type recombinase/integrase [Propylenella sp.]
MVRYNAKNERIKKAYFDLLRDADQKSRPTIDGIRKAVLRFEQFTDCADFGTFNSEQAVGFKKHMARSRAQRTGKPLSDATVLSTLNAVQEFFRWLVGQPGFKRKLQAADIRYLNLSRKEVAAAQAPATRRVPTLEQIATAIRSMPTETEVERRNRALVTFIIVTGMRDRAVASLRVKHINLEDRLVIQDPREVATKFSKRIDTFFFPVGNELEQIVIEWVRYLREVRLFGEDDPVFPRTKVAPNEEMIFATDGVEPVFWASAAPIRAIFREAFDAAGLPYFTPHSFRSTLAILGQRICRGDAELLKAWSQNLGHENMLTTLTSYGHVPLHRQGELVRNAGRSEVNDDRLERLMRMVERLQPTG